MPTINDYKKTALKNLGYTGNINDAEYRYLRALVTPYKGTIPDMWKKYLVSLGYTTGTLNDRLMRYFSSLGYTGTINQRWYKFWKEGGGVSRASQIVAHGQSGFATAGGWSNAGGLTSSLEVVNVRRPGVPVAKFLLPAGGAVDQVGTKRIKIPPTAWVNGVIDLQIYIPWASAGSFYMGLTVSSDTPAADPPTANPTNRRFMNISPDFITKGKWTSLRINRDGKIFTNGIPNGTAWVDVGTVDLNEIEYLGVLLGCTIAVPDAERYVLLDTVAINGYRKPFVIIGADGFGTSSHSSYLRSALSSRGFNGYIAGDGDLAAGASSFLTSWYEDGNDVISEGMNHTGYSANPSLLSGDYDTARGILDGLGFTRASKWFMYPVGGISAATIAILDGKGVTAARASFHPQVVISELGNTDFTHIGSYGSDQKSSAQMIAYVDDVIRCGTGMMIFGHDFVTSASISTETTIASFDTFLDYVKTKRDAGLIDVITPQQFLDRYT